jgi:uncharacterized protein YggE
MKKILLILLLTTSCLYLSGCGKQAPYTTPSSAGITVTGTGSVEVMANVVYIDLSIVTDNVSATQALSSNNKQMSEVFKTLEKNNIIKVGGHRHMRGDEASVVAGHFQTKRFQITRKYKYSAQNVRVPAGWIVTNQITIELTKVQGLGLASLLSELSRTETSSDLNINGINYGVKGQEESLTEARKLAVLNAIKKANLLANTAGLILGEPKSITEARVYIPNMRNIGMAAFKSEGDSVPVTEGQQKISVTVTMAFSIEGK